MRTSSETDASVTDTKAKLLPRITLAFFNRPRLTALLWIALTIFGIVSYTTLLKREGFPSVSIPIVIVNGVYAVNDPAQVDKTLAAPVAEAALEQDDISMVMTESGANFFTATLQYAENTNTDKAKAALERTIRSNGVVPEDVELTFAAPYFGVTGGSIDKVDATVSLFSTDDTISLEALSSKAQQAVDYLNKQDRTQVDNYFVQNPFQEVTNPVTGEASTVQRSFDRFGEQNDGKTTFRQSVIVGVASAKNADVIKLDDEITRQMEALEARPEFRGFNTAISASYAPSISEQISELQRVLLEGLLAILVVGSIVIAVRASFITVLAMVTVIASTIGVLFLLNYSLNVITLFALILGLSLIVDDTIIMVEAIDSARRRNTDRRLAVQQATRKIGRAMVAATLTAALSFVPLLFVGGVLGSFIKAIPVTIISALLISLIVALIFIPLFARYLLLGKKQMGEGNVREVAAKFEASIARLITRPMVWAHHSRRKEFAVGLTAVFISLAFIAAGGYIFQKVSFNIFPPSKDANQLAVSMTFPSGTTVAQAEATAARADALASDLIGEDLVESSYYGMANDRLATLFVELTPYGKREITAPQLVDKLEQRFETFDGAKVDAYQIDVGPPVSGFGININAADRPAAERLAADMASYLKGKKLTRLSGEEATITDATVSNTGIYQRVDDKQVLSVNAVFDATDTTTLTVLAQAAVTDYYDASKLKEFGLNTSDVTFNLGQESENQDSFKTLALAFPLVLVAIYLLLAIQFRSLLQPLLIFMALPFSFFGISLGLYLTDNSFSFFAMLGFFALIGLSIKNTILLTDYANQARRAGMSAVDAAVAALGERFRPLVATSLTAVFSLIPLALTSPFWEGLAVVLIFGLLSSTLLVLTVFPYYYLGGEYLRLKFSRRGALGWLVGNAVLIGLVGVLFEQPKFVLPALLLFSFGWLFLKIGRRPVRPRPPVAAG